MQINNEITQCERKSIQPTFLADSIYGGALLEVCPNDFVCFYDWVEYRVIQRIDANMENVYWVDDKYLLAITSVSSSYILKYNQEDAFNLTRIQAGDCFIYVLVESGEHQMLSSLPATSFNDSGKRDDEKWARKGPFMAAGLKYQSQLQQKHQDSHDSDYHKYKNQIQVMFTLSLYIAGFGASQSTFIMIKKIWVQIQCYHVKSKSIWVKSYCWSMYESIIFYILSQSATTHNK